MRRNVLGSAFELAIVEKPQTRRREGQQSAGPMHRLGKSRGSPRFVMIFQKSSQAIPKVRSDKQVFADGTGLLIAQPVVETFVIGVI